MSLNQCALCESCPVFIENITTQGFSICGKIFIYKWQSKSYVKKCCLLTYMFGGSRNELLHHGMFEQHSKKIDNAHSKIMIDDNNKRWDVYELKTTYKIGKVEHGKSNQFSKIDRSKITCVRTLGSYHIYTNSEYKKLLAETKKQSKELHSATIIDDIDMDNDGLNGYIYLLKDRTAVATNAQIFKVGKTTQLNFNRFKGYPKGFKIYFHMICLNCHEAETKILALFKQKYIQREDFGSETFEGNPKDMIKDITCLLFSE